MKLLFSLLAALVMLIASAALKPSVVSGAHDQMRNLPTVLKAAELAATGR